MKKAVAAISIVGIIVLFVAVPTWAAQSPDARLKALEIHVFGQSSYNAAMEPRPLHSEWLLVRFEGANISLASLNAVIKMSIDISGVMGADAKRKNPTHQVSEVVVIPDSRGEAAASYILYRGRMATFRVYFDNLPTPRWATEQEAKNLTAIGNYPAGGGILIKSEPR